LIRLIGLIGLIWLPAAAQVRLADETDRAAFRGWFVLLADAAFYRTPAEVTDCSSLVRYAFREALKPHTAEWLRVAGLPVAPGLPDVVRRPSPAGGVLPLFQTTDTPGAPLAEFVDAKTLVRWNAQPLSRDAGAARPGDLLYFRQERQRQPDHLMIVVGTSRLDPSASDFVVYHTGPDEHGPGEMRKVRLADLMRHPAARWRPIASNPAFIGVFRLAALS
jgi:uncharacterized protein YfaT (DUF1175 family)